MTQNPFTERGRINDPARFTGRWAELSLIFDRLEARRPVLISGSAAIGKSSLLTHITQSAPINMELLDLRSYYLDLAAPASGAEVYRVVVEALGSRGGNQAALEIALLNTEAPVLLCLDNAHVALAAGWGEQLLDELGRLVRGGRLMLVAALDGVPPIMSERYAMLKLGAFAQSEVRLVAEAYLEGTGISFSPVELRALFELSLAHPAYLQRAAYHLFESKIHSGYNWRAAYLEEARAQPIPGAPLPPEVFSGAQSELAQVSAYVDGTIEDQAPAPPRFEMTEPSPLLLAGAPLLLGALLFVITENLVLAIIIAGVGLAAVGLIQRHSA